MPGRRHGDKPLLQLFAKGQPFDVTGDEIAPRLHFVDPEQELRELQDGAHPIFVGAAGGNVGQAGFELFEAPAQLGYGVLVQAEDPLALAVHRVAQIFAAEERRIVVQPGAGGMDRGVVAFEAV